MSETKDLAETKIHVFEQLAKNYASFMFLTDKPQWHVAKDAFQLGYESAIDDFKPLVDAMIKFRDQITCYSGVVSLFSDGNMQDVYVGLQRCLREWQEIADE